MLSGLKVIAIAGPDHGGSTLFGDRDRINNTAGSKGYQALDFYQGLNDLITRIQALLAPPPPGKCLQVLEIIAHGSPRTCNDLSVTNAGVWGAALKGLNWCERDECSIYVSGCNTGLSHIPNQGAQSVAEALARAMPHATPGFKPLINVYGSKGYLSGTNMNGDEQTSASFSSGGTDHPAQKGASDANGSGCWIRYQNW